MIILAIPPRKQTTTFNRKPLNTKQNHESQAGKPCPGLGYAHRCDGVKPVNRITTPCDNCNDNTDVNNNNKNSYVIIIITICIVAEKHKNICTIYTELHFI